MLSVYTTPLPLELHQSELPLYFHTQPQAPGGETILPEGSPTLPDSEPPMDA